MLRISLLGEQVIEDDATGEIRSGSSRTLPLVGYLALPAGPPQSRQVMAGLFWPESTDAQALTNLRRELHLLRRGLDGGGSPGATPPHPPSPRPPPGRRGAAPGGGGGRGGGAGPGAGAPPPLRRRLGRDRRAGRRGHRGL